MLAVRLQHTYTPHTHAPDLVWIKPTALDMVATVNYVHMNRCCHGCIESQHAQIHNDTHLVQTYILRWSSFLHFLITRWCGCATLALTPISFSTWKYDLIEWWYCYYHHTNGIGTLEFHLIYGKMVSDLRKYSVLNCFSQIKWFTFSTPKNTLLACKWTNELLWNWRKNFLPTEIHKPNRLLTQLCHSLLFREWYPSKRSE